MPASYITKVLESIEAHCPANRPLLCITGGEPLLYSDLLSIMAEAFSRGFHWGMTTNATLINETKAKQLFNSGLTSVTVSLDGFESSHNWFRNSANAYSQARIGLDALIQNAPQKTRVDVITVVNRRNISELEEIWHNLSDLGIRSWRIVNMEPIGRALHNPELMLSPNEYQFLFDFIEEKHFNSKYLEVDYGCSHFLTTKYERRVRPYCFTCMAGLQVASVTCNGDIIGCLDIERRPELIQGNILKDDFWQIWESKFDYFRTDRTGLSGKCSICSDKNLCAGDSMHTWDFDKNVPRICIKDILREEAG